MVVSWIRRLPERNEGSAIVYLNTSVLYDQGKVVNKDLFLSLGWAEDRSNRPQNLFPNCEIRFPTAKSVSRPRNPFPNRSQEHIVAERFGQRVRFSRRLHLPIP